jgi:hypothetical protein
MLAGIYHYKEAYFYSTWNLLDFVLVWLAIFDNWFLPIAGIHIEVGVFLVLRMLRVMRIARLLRASQGLKVLVEGMFKSMASLGWILILLMVNTYIFAIICCQVLDGNLYKDMSEFDIQV